MKRLFSLLSALLPATGLAQGFQNLDFENANISVPALSFSTLLPAWQGTADGSALSTAYYAYLPLDEKVIGIYDSSFQSRVNLLPPPISGQFSAYLSVGGPLPPHDVQLAQTGLVPADTKSIRFETTAYNLINHYLSLASVGQLSLLVNGQSVPYVPLDVESNLVVWAADISPYAGTTTRIAWDLRTTGLGGAIGLDGISFSPEVVTAPEPSVLGLSALGLVLLARRLRYGQGRLD